MRKLTEIIIHCTATLPEWWSDRSAEEKVREVRSWHLAKGWSDIGYHFLIDRDGTVVEGRPIEKTGAHVKGHNTGTIGISLFGGHGASSTDKFEDHFTPEQDAALRTLVGKLRDTYPSITKVTGHNEYANKGCPGFNVGSWITNAKPQEPRTSASQSTTVRASAVQIASGVGTGIGALAALEGPAQIVALAFVGVVVLSSLWIMRERLKHWTNGVR